MPFNFFLGRTFSGGVVCLGKKGMTRKRLSFLLIFCFIRKRVGERASKYVLVTVLFLATKFLQC